MQRLIVIRRWADAVRYGLDTDRRMQRLLGIIGIVVVVAVLAISAVLYVVPLGRTTYSALLTEAGSVRAGDDVRVAGISVGSVESLELRDDSVRMEFTVKNDVRLGDVTSLEVRMLTPIGGHYVAAFPAGQTPLGSREIPADRVRLPYSLIQAMQDAQRPLAHVDGDTVRENLARLTSAVQRSPQSINTLADGLSTMVGLLDTQQRDVSRALDVAEEYVRVLSDSRKVIGNMLMKIGEMETQILGRRGEVIEALQVASELLSRIAAAEPAYRESLEPLADRLIEVKPPLEELGGKLATVGNDLAAAGDRLEALMTPEGIAVDHSGIIGSSRPVCIPVPGRPC